FRHLAISATLALGVASYAQSYEGLEFHSPLPGLMATDFNGMFDYIRANTRPDDAIIFDKPRTLALYTQHRSAAVYGTRQGDDLLSYMRSIGAQYLLFYEPLEPGDYLGVLGNHADEFERIYHSGGYALYRMKG